MRPDIIEARKRTPLLVKHLAITEHQADEMIGLVAYGMPQEASRFGFIVKDLPDLVRQIDERFGE